MAESVYERYCRIRDKAGYKDSDVAIGAKITKSTFSDWKSGRYTPKQQKLQKIADFLKVSSEYLMTGKDSDENTLPESEYELSNVYFSLAREAEQNGIDPRDIKMAIEMLKKIREEERNERLKK